MKHLVLGGARSGKSGYAERCAQVSERPLIYIATAEAGDEEMAARIARHQSERGEQWTTIESPLNLADTLQGCPADACVLVDCLTLWLSNSLAADCWEAEQQALLALVPELHCELILVSNEVGQGLVPTSALGRRFVDESGRLHQQLAAICEQVSFVTAGIAQTLKGDAHS